MDPTPFSPATPLEPSLPQNATPQTQPPGAAPNKKQRNSNTQKNIA